MAARATRRRSVRKEVEVKIDHKMEAAISQSPLKTERYHLTICLKCSRMQYSNNFCWKCSQKNHFDDVSVPVNWIRLLIFPCHSPNKGSLGSLQFRSARVQKVHMYALVLGLTVQCTANTKQQQKHITSFQMVICLCFVHYLPNSIKSLLTLSGVQKCIHAQLSHLIDD